MSDPQTPLFQILMYECDRCQFQQKILIEGNPHLPEGWRRENGYVLCGRCDMNAMESEYREAVCMDYAEFNVENAGGSEPPC